MKHSDVDNAYVSLCMRFRTASQLSNNTVKQRYTRGFNIQSDGNNVEVSSLFYFPSWKYRAASTRKTVDILLKSSEWYLCDKGEITKSTVQVIYLTGGSLEPLLALHYDFEAPPQAAHPIFHAQLGMTDLSVEELKTVGIRSALENPPKPLYGNVRIPTPCMTLGATLLLLAADHWPESEFNMFLADIRSNEMIGWDADCNLEASLQQSRGYLHSHHWYQ